MGYTSFSSFFSYFLLCTSFFSCICLFFSHKLHINLFVRVFIPYRSLFSFFLVHKYFFYKYISHISYFIFHIIMFGSGKCFKKDCGCQKFWQKLDSDANMCGCEHHEAFHEQVVIYFFF